MRWDSFLQQPANQTGGGCRDNRGESARLSLRVYNEKLQAKGAFYHRQADLGGQQRSTAVKLNTNSFTSIKQIQVQIQTGPSRHTHITLQDL